MTASIETHPLLDPIAFAGALVLAPLAFAAMTFWFLFIPVVAIFFGAVPYLVFGTPVFLWMVTRYPTDFGTLAIGGLLSHALFILCFALWQNAQPASPRGLLAIMALWGIPFAAGWGGSFAWMYQAFYRSPVR
jgi:hypothetical protein